MKRRLHTRTVLLAVLMLAPALAPALSFVHTALRRSEPANGAHLMVAPGRLVLEFTEIVALATARVTLRGPTGDTIPLAPLRHVDSTRRVVNAVLLGSPHAGGYSVEWTVAGSDGHPVRGTFRFTIDTAAAGVALTADTAVSPRDSGRAGAAPGGAPGAPGASALDASSPWYVAVRFLSFAAILAVFGSIALGTLVVPRASLDDEVREHVLASARRLGLGSAVVLLGLAAVRLVMQALALHGSVRAAGVGHLLAGSVWGFGWTLQAAATLLVGALLGLRPRPFSPVLLIPMAGIALSASLSGHPVALSGGAAPLAVVLDAVHVLAAGIWLGTVAVVVLVVIPRASHPPGEARAQNLRRLLVAFTPMALASAAVLFMSGAAGAWLQLGSVAALFTSAYGRLLLMKLALLVGIAALGALNWRRFVPRLAAARGVSALRASTGAELTLAIIVLLVTAVLTATPPPASVIP